MQKSRLEEAKLWSHSGAPSQIYKSHRQLKSTHGKNAASPVIRSASLVAPLSYFKQQGLLFSPFLPMVEKPISKEEPISLNSSMYMQEGCSEAHLLSKYPNTFRLPKKVDALTCTDQELENLVEELCVQQGHPLVVQNLHETPQFDSKLFSKAWLQTHLADKRVHVRDLKTCLDKKLPFDKFMDLSQKQAFVRYYGKDLDCPEEWKRALFIPPFLRALGPNDINGLLDPQTRIETLMIYVGYGGTYTSTHFDACASVGHNILLHADASNLDFHLTFRLLSSLVYGGARGCQQSTSLLASAWRRQHIH
ncbi:hypothetical protein DSO57_1015835 [Entomophthora muscae]|uniref:Uncharacterized protein n=1 Tax=Entomophthora muscae TaxID=34485 RepID=A0ACC2TFZ5_9FUNG|nr:hypothetical protein DSO57_1015835 [Entomophthora muscae]